MRVAYVDMVGGAAGDMLMGAWIDAGVDPVVLERALRTVVADGWEFQLERVTRQGLAATHVDLVIPGEDHHAHAGHHEHKSEHRHDHAHAEDGDHGHGTLHGRGRPGAERRLADVLALVRASGLTSRQIERACAIYTRLAQAEARVHGMSVEEVVFHEVGQIDAILDVAGTCIALDLLGIDALYCSAFPSGHGVAKMHHGAYPNPSPGTTELTRGYPLRMVDIASELVTVTGAAILTTLVEAPGTRVDMTLERIGYGAGRSNFPFPNVVRVLIGEALGSSAGDEVAVLEANVDDMSPEFYELALERVFAAGALDVWLTPIVMKKGRPAHTLSALARPSDADAVARAIVRETSTIGVRIRHERRVVTPREIVMIDTAYGAVRVKRVSVDGVVRAKPEYEDCLRIARAEGLPLANVVATVETALRMEGQA